MSLRNLIKTVILSCDVILDRAEQATYAIEELLFDRQDYPKVLIHRGKHGDRCILIMDAEQEKAAWLAMFRAIDRWDGYYIDLDGDQARWYEEAILGCEVSARFLLQSRSDYEYEEVFTECVETPQSLNRKLQ